MQTNTNSLDPTKGMTLAYRKANRKWKRFIFIVEVYRYKDKRGKKKFYVKTNLPFSLVKKYQLLDKINQPLVTDNVDTLMMKFVDEFCDNVIQDESAEVFFFTKDMRITPITIKKGAWDLSRELGFILFKNWKHLIVSEEPRLHYLLLSAINEGMLFNTKDVKVDRVYRKTFHRQISNEKFAETYVDHYHELNRFYRITFSTHNKTILVAIKNDVCFLAIKL